MGIYYPPVDEHDAVVSTALHVVATTHYSRADDPHEDAAYEYSVEQLALAARALAEAVDRKPADEQPIGWARDGQGSELHHLRQESLLFRSLAQEFRVPLTNSVGGYGEVVVRRWTLAEDRWQVTDGATTDPKVWIDGDWLPITAVGLEKAHPYTLDEALKTAHQVAEYEGAAFEAWVKATKDAYQYQCPQCMRWAFWENGRGTQHGDEVDEFWCPVCGAESRASLCERRPAQGGGK